MGQAIVTILLWFSAISCGLIAGLYFAFSAFVMTALGRIDQAAGISAMNAINTSILRSLFMPIFFGSSVASLLLALIAVFGWDSPGSAMMLLGGVVYVAGMFVCTLIFNVPLNNELAAVDPASPRGAEVWARFLRDWTFWNHVRTVASTAAMALFIAAIAARSGGLSG